MRAHFSEFTYGFCLTHELVNQFGSFSTPAPVFPSLYQEGQTGFGFDVAVDVGGVPLFLQFKLSDHMQRSTAREWEIFGENYFRFALHALRHSQQHNLLLQLEANGNLVYYAAPLFNTEDELNNAFRFHHLVSESVFVRPSLIGALPDDKPHYVAFKPHWPVGYLCSKPRAFGPVIQGGNIVEELLLQSGGHRYIRGGESFDRLSAEMIRIGLGRAGDSVRGAYVEFTGRLAPESRAAFLARVLFGAELILYQPAIGTLG
jgi:hypothetical protein